MPKSFLPSASALPVLQCRQILNITIPVLLAILIAWTRLCHSRCRGNLLNKIFGAGDLTTTQWVVCFRAALPLLLLWEIAKFIQRRRIASGKVEAPEW